MKLYSGKIPILASEIVRALVDENLIETENSDEVELDIAAVLKEYSRQDRDFTEKAKDLCEKRGMSYSSFPKLKRQLADQAGFAVGDDVLDYIMTQVIGSFLHSQFVEEVFGEDQDLKRVMRPIIKRHTEIEDDLDKEARSKIKNLAEGTRDWEIEYAKAMDQVRRRRKLD
jgi:hypothetical protein